MKKNPDYFYLFVFVLAALVLFSGWLSLAEPNLKYDWGFALYNWQQSWLGVVSAWNDLFLGEATVINAAWPVISLFVGVGLLLSFSVTTFLQIFVVVASIMAGYGLFALARYWRLPPAAAVFGGLLYAFAPAFFVRIVVGFVFYLLAYALFPWLLLCWWRARSADRNGRRAYWLAPLLLTAMSSQPQYFFMAALILLADTVLAPTKAYRGAAVRHLGYMLLTLIIAHSPWLYMLFRGGTERAVSGAELGSSLATIQSLPHNLWRTLIGADHHILFPVFEQLQADRWYLAGTLAVVVLALAAPIIRFSRQVRVLIIGLTISLILGLGPIIPTGPLYVWWYQNFPLTNIFREVYHWAGLTTLALALLAATTAGWLLARSRWLLIPLLILVWLWVRPFTHTNFYGYITSFNLPAGYKELVADEPAAHLTRSFFLPPLGFLKFHDDRSPGAVNSDVWAISTNRSQLPFQSSVLDFPSEAQGLRNATVMSFLGLSSESAAGYLKAAAVKEVIVRPDLVSQFNELFQIVTNNDALARRWRNPNYDALAVAQGLTLSEQIEGANIYRVADSQPLISFAERPVLAAADWRAISRGDGDAVFFAEDLTDVPTRWRELITSLPTLSPASEIQAAHFNSYNFINSMKFDVKSQPTAGWVRPAAIWWWREELATSRDDYIFTDGERQLSFTWAGRPEKRRVLVKVWQSRRALSLTLSSAQWSEELDTNEPTEGRFVWHDLGSRELAQEMRITTEGESGLAQLLLVPESEWDSYLQPKSEERWRPAGQQDDLSVTRVRPDRYDIDYRSDQERLLVVRLGFDSGWRLQLNQQLLVPLPINGYGMAFVVPAGQHVGQLLFAPQRWYALAQVVAASWLLGLAVMAYQFPRPAQQKKKGRR